ncbi:ATP-binding response regulator [Bacteroides uniformis]|uniref:histidine kinase n=1 Tax=Bacteroides uniformis TaxID=820 RepID=A0A6I0LRR5_BACUN|nr:response regulator [Bacteroides uniformis]KAB4254006.1 response regulator [Bacteroides uniformis]KAB4257574.1 response regulator [Bacteroides uniformis]KAB4260162.1 response regulator [Bacteroides uniformis]
MTKLLLQHKILLGYILMIIIIGSMATVLFHERNRIQIIEKETTAIRQVRRDINVIHRHITNLAMYGESVIAWDENDYQSYRENRLYVDTLLQMLRHSHNEFIRFEQIDTLRELLIKKEKHLLQIMQAYHLQKEADSLLINRLPVITSLVTNPRTIVQKKKGIAGWFGKKETVRIAPSPNALYSLNEQLINIHEERIRNIAIYTDSLRVSNKELNGKLHILITYLNDQMQTAFQLREQNIEKSHKRSTRIITGLVITAIVLLFISYLIIQQELRRETRQKLQIKSVIDKNYELLETRKHIILTISHDIRAPLSIINGSAELAMDIRDKKRRNTHLTNISLVCKHVLHLLNNLLDVYRLNEAKETRNDVPFNLRELLERIATGFSHIVNNKGILFQCEFKNIDAVLYGDTDRIEQIIDNLLANAVKFTEAGTIVFYAAYENGQLSLKIKDTGIGMSEDTLSRIFRPFERLSSDSNPDGFGLGLPITKGLVKLLGGTIEVESEIGHGSTFHVSLPLPVSAERIENETPMLQEPPALPQQVLVIDNDPLQLEIVKEMLERSGVICTTCSNVKDLVREMRKKDYDLLLSDIQMSRTNGFEVLTLLRNSNIGNSRTIPVIAMTARGDREKNTFIKSGFADCIYKPFSMSELLSLLSTIVYHSEEEEPQSPDFVALTAEVRDKRKLLRSFIFQSRQDIKDLRAALKDGNRTELLEIIHRMMPTWELLQSDELLMDFRAALKNSVLGKDSLEEYTGQITEQAATLIREAEKEIRRLTDEAENTDR